MDLRNTPFPSSLCLRVTRRCNAACAFCQAPYTDRGELAESAVADIVRLASDRGVRSVKFSGGEPTLRRDLPELLRRTAGEGLRPVVITNGLSLRPAVLAACAETGAELKFSIHKPSAENDSVLGVRSFDRVCANLARAVAAGVRVSVNTVLPGGVGMAEMRAMTLFARDSGAWKLSFIPVVPRGRAAGQERFSFAADALAAVRGRISCLSEEFAGDLVIRCIDIRLHDYWVVENDGSLWIERASEEKDVKICGAEEIAAFARLARTGKGAVAAEP